MFIEITDFIQSHMVMVFFIYGLSFFLLGTAVFFQVRKGSGFKLGKYLWLLAGFGLVHGLNEWMDMFLLIGNTYWVPEEIIRIRIIRFFVGQSSYVFLFQFGIRLVLSNSKKKFEPLFKATLILYVVAILGVLVWGIQSKFNAHWFLISDITMRYFLAFPGAGLTGVGFFFERKNPEIIKIGNSGVLIGLTGLAVCFSLYAIFTGLIVKPGAFFPASVINYTSFMNLTGFPVQIFRTGCAIASVVFLGKVLNIFEIETNKKLENAYKEIIKISNREKMRIGQDLHDGLGQQLTGISYMSGLLEKKLKKESHREVTTASEIKKLLEHSIYTAKTLVRGLYPVIIENDGLGLGLRELAESTEKIFAVSCSAQIDESVLITDPDTAIHLFRIAQEAVSNSVKHSKANEIRIELNQVKGTAVLTVTDDGEGIPDNIDESDNIGLRSMRYRASVIDGQLEIRRGSKNGTLIKCTILNEEPKTKNFDC